MTSSRIELISGHTLQHIAEIEQVSQIVDATFSSSPCDPFSIVSCAVNGDVKVNLTQTQTQSDERM